MNQHIEDADAPFWEAACEAERLASSLHRALDNLTRETDTGDAKSIWRLVSEILEVRRPALLGMLQRFGVEAMHWRLRQGAEVEGEMP